VTRRGGERCSRSLAERTGKRPRKAVPRTRVTWSHHKSTPGGARGTLRLPPKAGVLRRGMTEDEARS